MFISVTTVWGTALVAVDQIAYIRPKTNFNPSRPELKTLINLKRIGDDSSPILAVSETVEEVAERIEAKTNDR